MKTEKLSENPDKPDEKITYEQFGKNAAAKSDANSDVLAGNLEIVYKEIIKQAQADEKGLVNKITGLQNEILSLKKNSTAS